MTPDEMRAIALELVHSIGYGAGLKENLVTDDFTWWGYGVGQLDLEGFKALARTIRPAMPRPPVLTIMGTAAEGDRVAVEADGDCILANGRRYQNHYHWVVRFRGPRVCALKEFYDSKYAHETIGSALLDTLPQRIAEDVGLSKSS
jgi:ketosteroid isomerase-like protein